MNNVGAVGFGASYTQGVQSRSHQEDSKQNIQQQEQQSPQTQQNSVKPDDVYKFMSANLGIDVEKIKNNGQATKVIKISDYVSPEQAKRIAGFITDFEEQIANGLTSVQNEFPEMSKETAQTLVLMLALFDFEY